MEVNEIRCPHCGSSDIGLASLFQSVSALCDQEEVAEKHCPACSKDYRIERAISVNYQVHPEVDNLHAGSAA